MREGWFRSTLGSLAELSIGRTPPRNDPRYWAVTSERPFCTIGDMTSSVITQTREGVTALAESEGRAKRVHAGTLLMSFKLTLGRISFAAVDLFPNEAIVAIRPDTTHVSAEFLALSLAAADLSARSGTAVKGQTLNRESLQAIPVSVPPLDEQRRIVDLIGSLDAATQASARLVDRAGAMARAAGNAVWVGPAPMASLSSLGNLITGTTPRTTESHLWQPPEVPFVAPGDFDRIRLDHSARMVSSAGAEAARRIPAGSVIQVCIGATIGKVAVTSREACTNQQVNALVGLELPDAFFVAGALGAPTGLRVLAARAARTALPIINKTSWGSLEIPWPAPDERRRIGELVQAADGLRSSAICSAGRARRLRRALLHELLSGNGAIPPTYDRILEPA